MSVLLETQHLTKYYGKNSKYAKGRNSLVKAVDDVSVKIEKGKSVALIGESGSGKTTLGKLISCLESSQSGKILFHGKEIEKLRGKALQHVRKDMQIIFQSSGGVFDPLFTIGENITEVLKNYEKLSAAEYRSRVEEVLVRVGLDASYADRYSTNLSGGECQRANIARALVLRPEFVICDEPVSNLDYSIRKNILNLLKKMQEEYGLTYLLITHDLSNVPYVCQQVAIMYQGKIVEFIDSTDHLEEKVMHPYTKLLFQSIPVKHPKERKTEERLQEAVQTKSFDQGCDFQNRCPCCTERCRTETPQLRNVTNGHSIMCHNIEKKENKS